MLQANLLFLCGYILILCIVFTLLRLAKLSLLRPSIPMLFVVSYLVFSYIGFPYLVFGWNRNAIWLGATDRGVIIATWAYGGITLILVCLGFVYARWVLNLRPDGLQLPKTDVVVRISMVRIVALLLVCLIALWIYIRSIPAVALFGLLQNGGDNVRMARSDATNALSHAWRYQFFPNQVAPFLSYVLLAAYVYKPQRRYLIGFVIAAAIAVFASIMNLTRGNLPFYAASLVFLYFLIRRKKIPLRTGFLYTIIAGGFVIGLIVAISGTDMSSALYALLERTFSGYPLASYYYLIAFPNVHGFLWGQSFPNPGGLLPFEHFRLTVFVSEFIFGQLVGIVGSAPGPFWTEMYANFGLIGVLLAPFPVGIFLWLLHVWTTTWPASPVYDGLITYLAFYIQPLSTSTLSRFFFVPEIFLILLVAFLISTRRQRMQPISQMSSQPDIQVPG